MSEELIPHITDNPGAWEPGTNSGIITDVNAKGTEGQPIYGLLDQALQTPTSAPPATPTTDQGGDTFENRLGNPTTSWTYMGDGMWKNFRTGEQRSATSTTATTDIAGFTPFTETPAGQGDLENLKQINASLGFLTAEEEAAIAAQAEREGLKYDTLIAQAIEQKRQGVSSGTIRAGQRGGFESTQMAGAAALAPTVGGTFIGQGGELEKVKSAYDLNISNLETQKQQAIAAAKAALRDAKLTGKTDSYNRAVKLYELAEKSHNDAIDYAAKKVEALKAAQNLSTETVKTNLDNLSYAAKAGIKVPSNVSDALDQYFGAGFTKGYQSVAEQAAKADTSEKQIELTKSIVDILAKVPAGQEIQIGDATYTGFSSDNGNKVFKEVDNSGNVTFLTVDPEGNVINSASGGKVSTTKSSGDGGGGGGLSTKFWSEVDAGKNELQQGEPWSNVWNRIKLQYPDVPDETIDQALGTSWREPGAYQTWAASKAVGGGGGALGSYEEIGTAK
jgi:hypothetical protein